jgi:hypothetical protein
MPLSPDLLAKQMQLVTGLITPYASKEYLAIATGVCNGIKQGSAKVIVTGAAGTPPGSGVGIGALQGGPVMMLPIVITNFIGIIPPPQGFPMPLQALYFLSISMISLHIITNLQVSVSNTPVPGDPPYTVAVGVGTITPGSYLVNGDLIKELILAEYIKNKMDPITPTKEKTAEAIGKSTEQIFKLATTIIPIVGGVITPPSAPGTDTRTATLS